MVIPVPTQQQRLNIRLGIRANAPFHLGILAQDATKAHTHYFRRRVPFRPTDFEEGTSYREISIKLPVSPKTLSLELYDKHRPDDQRFRIEDFKVSPLPPAQVWAKKHMHDFITFAEDFSQKAGYRNAGFYHSPDYQFLIHYLPRIMGQDGEELVTPARTHRITGRHQVSQRYFRQFSIPIRMFILLHERQHFTLPTRQEVPADLAALKLYMDLGYPTIEAIYAMTKIFLMHPNTLGAIHSTRVRKILEFIEQYKKQQQLNKAA